MLQVQLSDPEGQQRAVNHEQTRLQSFHSQADNSGQIYSNLHNGTASVQQALKASILCCRRTLTYETC